MPISSIVTKPASVQPGQSRLPLTTAEVPRIEHPGKRSFKVGPRGGPAGRDDGEGGERLSRPKVRSGAWRCCPRASARVARRSQCEPSRSRGEPPWEFSPGGGAAAWLRKESPRIVRWRPEATEKPELARFCRRLALHGRPLAACRREAKANRTAWSRSDRAEAGETEAAAGAERGQVLTSVSLLLFSPSSFSMGVVGSVARLAARVSANGSSVLSTSRSCW